MRTRIAEIQTRLADIDAWSAEARAASILKGLGFDDAEQQHARVRRSRAAGGCGWPWPAVLFAQPDLLLLDEPTNYLDLEGALWLESYLAKYPHTVIVISHDRGLLNRAVGAILHLEDRKLTFYQGPYDQFARQRAERRAQASAIAKKQQARVAHLQSFVDRFRAKASKAKQAQSRLKMIERMDMVAAPEEIAKRVFTFPQPDELSPPIIRVENGVTGYGETEVLAQAGPADRSGRPHRASGQERSGQVDAGQAAVGPFAIDGRADHPVVEAAHRVLCPAPGGRAARRRDAAGPPATRCARTRCRHATGRGWPGSG